MTISYKGFTMMKNKQDTQTVLSIFEDTVVRYPNAPALKLGENSLNYFELNGKANALARQLAEKGTRKGDVVPIIIGNGINVVLSYLALMKVGAAFVPVDPLWPKERINLLMRQMHSEYIIVCDSLFSEKNYTSFEVNYRYLDISLPNNSIDTNPEDVFYGFFTSGTTGVPKCALNLHKGLVNRLMYMNKILDPEKTPVVLQNSNFVFDPSIWQIFWPLINGNCVVLIDNKESLDVAALLEIMHNEKVNIMDFVPSEFHLVVEFLKENQEYRMCMSSVRHILVGGEEMNPYDVYEFLAHFPNIQIFNTYGPTETSIGIMFYLVDEKRYNPIPIGKPIDNTFIRIINADGDICNVGEIGEIHIGGVCLGAGYYNDPVRTKSSFIDYYDCHLNKAIKLYKTGDMGVLAYDGNVYFKGRIDNQIKHAGYRVDLGEIEHAIQSFPGIKQACVLLVCHNNENNELVACIRAKETTHIDIEHLKAHIGEIIPKPLIPNTFYFTSVFPLNHNGKLDRKALERIYISETLLSA